MCVWRWGEEGCGEQGPRVLQGFPGRGGSEMGGSQGEHGKEYGKMTLERGPRRERQRWGTGTTLGSSTTYAIPDNSLYSTECPLAPGSGLSPCEAVRCAHSTDCVCRSRGLASRHPWARGARGPVLRPVEITEDLKKSQAKDKGSWVKNGLECGLKVQGRVEKEAGGQLTNLTDQGKPSSAHTCSPACCCQMPEQEEKLLSVTQFPKARKFPNFHLSITHLLSDTLSSSFLMIPILYIEKLRPRKFR